MEKLKSEITKLKEQLDKNEDNSLKVSDLEAKHAAAISKHEKKLDNDKWINRKKECRQRIAKNFTLEKMVTRYGEVWSIDH